LELLHRVADVRPRLQRVRVRRLLHAQRDGGLQVHVSVDRVVLRAELHARHVADPRDAALRGALDDRGGEFLGRLEPAVRADVELIRGRVVVERRRADRAAGDLDVVVAQRGDDLLDGEIARGGALGIDPDAHRVVARRVRVYVADA